jgi:hypothetical protein
MPELATELREELKEKVKTGVLKSPQEIMKTYTISERQAQDYIKKYGAAKAAHRPPKMAAPIEEPVLEDDPEPDEDEAICTGCGDEE